MNVSIYRSLRSLNLFACLLLSGLTLALPSLAQVKPIASPQKESTAIANFVDVAAKSGLTMMNVFGGTDTKKYIIETTGTGDAIFDYDNDRWHEIFIVNVTTL